MLPRQVLALPLFILCWQLGILNTYAAQILPFIVSPFGIFLFRQFFKIIPDDVVHAARLDGLSELAIVFRVMLPMALRAPHLLQRLIRLPYVVQLLAMRDHLPLACFSYRLMSRSRFNRESF